MIAANDDTDTEINETESVNHQRKTKAKHRHQQHHHQHHQQHHHQHSHNQANKITQSQSQTNQPSINIRRIQKSSNVGLFNKGVKSKFFDRQGIFVNWLVFFFYMCKQTNTHKHAQNTHKLKYTQTYTLHIIYI